MIKKTIGALLFSILLFIGSFSFTNAGEVNLYLFSSDSCPHCKAEKAFLKEIAPKYPDLKIHEFEVSKNRDNARIFSDVSKLLNANANGVPFTVIGDKYFIGFLEGVVDKKIEERIEYCINNSCEDVVNDKLGILNNQQSTISSQQSDGKEVTEDVKFTVPILGEITAKTVSLPLLTIVLGFIDGFNPCAMWVLIFLISMLIGMKSGPKRWILGIVFILASALVYFAFMSLWLNLIIFIGFIFWVRVAIGLVALGGGIYGLKKGLQSKLVCEVSSSKTQQKIIGKVRELLSNSSFWLALIGIVILAFSVNLVELICSAGLPAVYTQILVLNNLSNLQYYSYILLYVFFFMLDDLIVFFISMKALEISGVTTKYSKLTRIIGGIIMIIVGVLLIFKPEWIMFG